MPLSPNLTPTNNLPAIPRGGWQVSRLRGWGTAASNWCARICSDLCGPRERFAFGILMYHRMCDPVPGQPAPTWNVTPVNFRRQIQGLLRRGWEPWPLRKVLNYQLEFRLIPRRVFVVTFDDCYENVFENAWPVLQELKVPATFFLATAYLDSPLPFPSDDWMGAGAVAVPELTWRPIRTDQCRQMQQSGLVELAAHTHSHADFRGRLPDFAADLALCQAELRHRFGLTTTTFAFPYGTKATGFSGPPLLDVVKEAGHLCALTTEPKLVHSHDDPFDWGRFEACAHDSAADLAAKLGGWYGTLKAVGKAALGRNRHSCSAGSIPTTATAAPQAKIL